MRAGRPRRGVQCLAIPLLLCVSFTIQRSLIAASVQWARLLVHMLARASRLTHLRHSTSPARLPRSTADRASNPQIGFSGNWAIKMATQRRRQAAAGGAAPSGPYGGEGFRVAEELSERAEEAVEELEDRLQ